MKTVLITGASGFLGSWFTDWFIRNEVPVNLWLVDIKDHPTGLPVDLQDIVTWLDDFDREVDAVFHFAAPVGGRERIEGDPLYNADSLRIDSVVFRWAINHAKTLIYPSSSAVYGTTLQEGDGVVLREDMFRPQDTLWPAPDEMYGFTKMAGEMLAYKAAKYGLNTLVLRPFSGYGQGQAFDYPVPSIVRRALHHEDPIQVWGPGTQRRDFVHVSDIVGATMARLEAGVTGYETMNIGRGMAVSFNEIAQIAAALADYEPAIENLVDKPMGVNSRFADITRMSEFYTPLVSLAEGLHRTMTWVKSLETPVKIGA
jgi:nucleoside-diphosphate-sugar epimerase